jgi:hypothetical protein
MEQKTVIDTADTENATQGLSSSVCLQRGLEKADNVDRDSLIEAHKWFNIAYARGNKDALAYRQEMAAEMSHAEISKAQKLAREWLARNSN